MVLGSLERGKVTCSKQKQKRGTGRAAQLPKRLSVHDMLLAPPRPQYNQHGSSLLVVRKSLTHPDFERRSLAGEGYDSKT